MLENNKEIYHGMPEIFEKLSALEKKAFLSAEMLDIDDIEDEEQEKINQYHLKIGDLTYISHMYGGEY
jgi:hypothetical protein